MHTYIHTYVYHKYISFIDKPGLTILQPSKYKDSILRLFATVIPKCTSQEDFLTIHLCLIFTCFLCYLFFSSISITF